MERIISTRNSNKIKQHLFLFLYTLLLSLSIYLFSILHHNTSSNSSFYSAVSSISSMHSSDLHPTPTTHPYSSLPHRHTLHHIPHPHRPHHHRSRPHHRSRHPH